HFLVPQAVDDGVQHGRDHSIEDRGGLISDAGLLAPGFHVREDDGAIEKQHHSQVRRAGGEGFVASSG
ncbi:hypothetical protein DBR06_SOUSAS7810046, partial [Sousa chinensis]